MFLFAAAVVVAVAVVAVAVVAVVAVAVAAEVCYDDVADQAICAAQK